MHFKHFFAELKRRHVFRVAVVYAVVAWVVIQVASDIFPALKLPDWTVTLVVILSFLGFPIALVLAVQAAFAKTATTSGLRPGGCPGERFSLLLRACC